MPAGINHNCCPVDVYTKPMSVSVTTLITSVMELDFVLFRNLDTLALVSMARERIQEKRRQRSLPHDNLLIKQPRERLWGDKRLLGKFNFIEKLTGFKKRMTDHKDDRCMTAYLKAVMKDGLNHVELSSLRAFLPGGAPLLDFLAIDLERIDCWAYPAREMILEFQENRGLGNYMLKGVEVREIVVGVTSGERIKEITDWVFAQYHQDEVKFPTGVISMDVEELQGTLFDCLRLAGRLMFKPGRVLSKVPEDREVDGFADRSYQLPVKMMFGNGMTWAVMVSLDLGWNGREHTLRKQRPQPELLSLIEKLPVCVGLCVKSDVSEIETFYSVISGRDVSMKGFIDLSVIATLAGWELSSRGMTVMGIQVIGTILNKCVSIADGQWGRRWKDISDSLKIYALGDLKFGYMSYIILSAVLLRDFFPDPDVVGRYAQEFQGTIVKWFSNLLLNTMRNKELCSADLLNAESRLDLMGCIRDRSADNELAAESPLDVKLWMDLLGTWPSITHGGVRYLLEARRWFLKQALVLAKFGGNASGEIPLLMRNPNEDDVKYSLFEMADDVFDVVFWNEGTSRPGFELARPKQTEAMLPQVTMETLGEYKLTRHCHLADRSQRGLIYEWARMNLSEIPRFQKRLIEDTQFFNWYHSYYEVLCHMYVRCVDKPGVRVPKLDAARSRKDEELRDTEYAMMLKSEEEFTVRKKRVKMVDDMLVKGDKLERAFWRHELPPLLVWRTKKRGEKRPRSRSRSRAKSQCLAQRDVPASQLQSVAGPSRVRSLGEKEKSRARSVFALAPYNPVLALSLIHI